MLAPVRTVAPADTPVSLAEAKAHLRVEHSDDDEMILTLIEAATGHLDGWSGILGRALVTQTWRQDFGSFGCGLRLALAPVASVSSVTYYDGANASQTLADTVYSKFVDARGPYLGLAPDQSWPGTFSRPDAVRVTYVCGVAAADVPARIKVVIKLLVGHWYENREAVVPGASPSELPMAVTALLAPLRRVGV